MNTYDETRRDSSCDAFIVTSYDVCNPGFGKLRFVSCLAAARLNTCPRWRNADAILGITVQPLADLPLCPVKGEQLTQEILPGITED
jgi:hypothetical protein